MTFGIKANKQRAIIGHGLLRRLSNLPSAQAPKTALTRMMHFILIDWLVDVAVEFRLGDMTLALTSSLVDRYLVVSLPYVHS